jgi:hypothetical protein
MAKFLTGNELNSELEKLFARADEQLILISPYFRLHDRFISALKTKLKDPRLKIIIVFGKNEDDFSKSMKQEDFDFFKQFPNIEILYEKRLHAKYYANETSAILTSMNLYNYSQDNNIEAGVLTKATLIGNLANNIVANMTGEDSFDQTAAAYFKLVIDQSIPLYKKVPVYESTLLGFSKKYTSSKIEIDKMSDFFTKKVLTIPKYSTAEYPLKKVLSSHSSEHNQAYCIRTGARIPFNIQRPYAENILTNKASPEVPEKYCHFSGEETNGKTTSSKPILSKNWKKAKEKYEF